MGFDFRAAAKGQPLDFEHSEVYTGGSKRPDTHTLRGMHPDTGDEVGWLKYDVPRRKADKIYVQRMEVHEQHKGNGYAGQLMDEMQRRHPGTPIDHGDRTDEGQRWWDSYIEGKPVRRGRTIAALDETADGQDTGPAEAYLPNTDQPASCSYCGGTDFTNLTDNGRVRQATCAVCGGTMSAHDSAQWTPELVGDPSNHPKPDADPRSGGVGGAGAVTYDPLARPNNDRIAKLTDPEMHEVLTRFGHNHGTGRQHFEREHTVTPVKHAGFRGYVEEYDGAHEDHQAEDAQAYGSRHPDGGFDEDLYDASAPEPNTRQRRDYEDYGSYGQTFRDQHDENYAKAKREKDETVKPVASHGALHQWLGNESEYDHPLFHKHGEVQNVPLHHPIYATQPYVVDRHVNRYVQNPGDTVDHVQRHGLTPHNEAYPGTHMPMIVKHEGNYFTVEGHHRTASALLRKEPHIKALVFDADKHGFPEDVSRDAVDLGEEHDGFQRYSMLIGADCDFPGHDIQHAIRHHDDGVCTLTEMARQRSPKTAAVHELLPVSSDENEVLTTPTKHVGFVGYVEAEPTNFGKGDEKAVAAHAGVHEFRGYSGRENNFARWHEKGEIGPVPLTGGNVYATQSHVTNRGVNAYLEDPDRAPGGSGRPNYPGNERPMFVKHEGNYFTLDGHHRTAAALLRGDEHVEGHVYDADKHGFPKPQWAPSQYKRLPKSLDKYSALAGAYLGCGYDTDDEDEALQHELKYHDDGFCSAPSHGKTAAVDGPDWCTWRRAGQCTFPNDRNNTLLAIPQVRGACPWETRWQQQVCPISEPGPQALMSAKGSKMDDQFSPKFASWYDDDDEHEHNEDCAEYGCSHGEDEGEDWKENLDGVHEIHRGVGVLLHPSVHRIVHDESRPVHERAKILLNEIGKGDLQRRHGPSALNLGTHWTTDPYVAEDFAEKHNGGTAHASENETRMRQERNHAWGTDEYGDPKGQPATAVVIHAKPDLDSIDHHPDPMAHGSSDMYGYHEHGEREVPYHPGASVEVKGISWKPLDEDKGPDYTRHDFHEPQYHQAARVAMPSRNHPQPPEGISFSQYDAVGPGNDHPLWKGSADPWHEEGEETHPGWSHHLFKIHNGPHGDPYHNENMVGKIYYSKTKPGDPAHPALAVHDMKVLDEHRGHGYASAMQDELRARHPEHMFDHGGRSPAGQKWWDSYDDPGDPKLNLEHPDNASEVERYRPTQLQRDLAQSTFYRSGSAILRTARKDSEFRFHVVAAWKDVREKAKRIRREGGVNIKVATAQGLAGEVQGDHGSYQNYVTYRPGTWKIADWSCDCKWGDWAWERLRFHGRQCSHSLALVYEAQSRGMFGKEIKLGALTFGQENEVDEIRGISDRPISTIAASLLADDEDPADVMKLLMAYGLTHSGALQVVAEEEEHRRKCPYCGGTLTEEAIENHKCSHCGHTLGFVGSTVDEKRKHHKTNDTRRHAPDFGYGVPSWIGLPLSQCPQCEGLGCGHCGGTGQVVRDGQGHTADPVSDQNPDMGQMMSGGISDTSSLKSTGALGNEEWYHGTSTARLPEILQHGLRKPHLTNDHDQAVYYAGAEQDESGGDRVVLHVHVNPEHLRVDRAALSEPITGEDPPDLDHEPADHDWQVSRDHVGSVRHEGDIPPHHITHHEVLPHDHPDVYGGGFSPWTAKKNDEHEAALRRTAEANPHGLYLRFGQWPKDERSNNNVTGFKEEGVSVYDLDRHGEPMDPDPDYSREHQHDEHCDGDCDLDSWNDDYGNDTREEMEGRVNRAERNRRSGVDCPHETGHLVKGEMVGIGHDGEPLLRKVKRVGDWIDHRHMLIPGAEPHRLARGQYDEDYEPPAKGRHGALAPQEGPTVSGVALKANDTGRILMLQRGLEDEDDPARGTWEFPGGHHEDGDKTSLHAGIREWEEEVGQQFPEGGVVHHTWTSPNGVYQGHVVVIPSEKDLSMKDGRVVPNPDDPKGDNHEQAAWWDVEHAKKNPALRPEVKAGTPWKEIAKAGNGKEAAHDSWSPMQGEDDQPGFPYAAPLHSNSQNPASTGFATSEDPKNWNFEDEIPTSLIPSDSYDSMGYYGTLHDHPEPALPSTDGADDPVPDNPVSQYRPPETSGGIAPEESSATPNQFTGSVEDTLRQFQATAAAKGLMQDNPRRAGGDNVSFDFAANARAYLAQDKGLQKAALKDFDFREQQELINEGSREGVRARNFGDLQIEGTHYEALNKALGMDSEDPEELFM